MPKFTGACLCGKIHYSANADPIFMGVCHCKDCQRATGSAFSAVIAIPDASLKVEGKPKSVTAKARSGKSNHRSFCPDCGSTLMTRADAMPGVVMLATGPLDDATQFKPAMQIFCDSAQPWVQLGGAMNRFPGMPPQG